jgi:hypothetical protein
VSASGKKQMLAKIGIGAVYLYSQAQGDLPKFLHFITFTYLVSSHYSAFSLAKITPTHFEIQASL